MKTKIVLSQAEMVLLAIYRASNGTPIRVPFEEIVIRAWKDFPTHFSLNNYPQYPDSYPVNKRLYSDLITGRLVTSISKEVYKLTAKGLELARQIEESLSGEKTEKASTDILLNREQQEILKYLSRTRTFASWKEEKRDELIDYDARIFFQFSTGTIPRDRRRRVETVKEAIERAISLGEKDAEELQALCAFLIDKFPNLFKDDNQ